MGSILKYIGYMVTKWMIFYLYQYVEGGAGWNWERVKSLEDVQYTTWMLLALPALEMILMAVPLHIAIRQKGLILLFILLLTFTLEFAIGWYATNQQLATWMVIKILLSVGIFWLFYKKELQL